MLDKNFPYDEIIKSFKNSGQYDFINKFTEEELWKIYLLITFLNPQPEIIRCKNCKYNNNSPESNHANCELFYGMTDQMGFCSCAERKINEL